MTIKQRYSRGFSLIEMILYVFILVLMLAIIFEVVTSIVKSERVIRSLRNVENSAILSIERLEREIRAAESVDTALSALNSHPGVLVLDGTDESGDPKTLEFYLSNGRLLLREDGLESGALSSEDAVITNLIFRRFANSNSEGVKIEMTVESGAGAHYRERDFYATALIR